MRRSLIVFVKQPRPGLAKTRLGRGIGHVEAAWWYRHQSAHLIRMAARDRRWGTVLAVTPDAAGMTSRLWPAGIARTPQGSGDIGRRMVRTLMQMPPGPAVLVGADIPGLEARHIEQAFRRLGSHEVVLGPATDGGFWLIGLAGCRRLAAGVLDGVRWSSRHAMRDTIRRLGDRRIGFAATLADVDTAEDLLEARRQPAG